MVTRRPGDEVHPGSGTPVPIVVSDMDGTLSTVETWRGILAWLRTNHPSPAVRRFVAVRLPRVMLAKAGLIDRDAFRGRWMEDLARNLRGLATTEVEAMAAWVAEAYLWPERREAGIEAVRVTAAAARDDHPDTRLVLATAAWQPIGDAFARLLGADSVLGTPLEIRDGRATGRVLAPTQSGEQKAAAVRALAAGGTIIAAFGDTRADIPLLAMARRAVAVAPDPELRREAVARGWEILDAPAVGRPRDG